MARKERLSLRVTGEERMAIQKKASERYLDEATWARQVLLIAADYDHTQTPTVPKDESCCGHPEGAHIAEMVDRTMRLCLMCKPGEEYHEYSS